MALRLTKQDKEKLQKINNSVRAKKNRLKNNYNVDSTIEPLKISNVTSRTQLNNYYEEAREFIRGYGNKYRKNKYGFVARQVDINKAKYQVERANKERARRLQALKDEEFKTRGKSTGFTALDRFLMGDSRYSSYEPIKFDFNTIRNQKHFDKRLANIVYSSTPEYFNKKNETLKDNILSAIATNWGNLGLEAFKFISNLTPDEVARYYETEDVFNFEIFGSPQGLGDVNKNIEYFYQTFGLGDYREA